MKYMIILRFSIMIFLLSIMGPAAAQPALEATTTPFMERLTDHVPVSGRTLVGLLSTSGLQPPDGTGLLAGSMALPADLTGAGMVICVRATTQDGRYSAEDSFTLQRTVPKGGRADLDWPTKYAETTRTFALREFAAVARKGSCTEQMQMQQPELIPILVADGNTLGTLQVLVNTRGAAVTAALRDIETRRTLKRANCTRVSGASRVAFDARCVLGPASDLPPRVQLRLEQVSHDGLQIEVLESLVLQLSE